MADQRIADRYEPVEVVGRGAEAYVLKAVDLHHDRLVALKVRSAPNGADDELLAETRALLTLPPHPGLAHARHDLFDHERHVLVLDWVDGVDLGRVLADAGRPGLPVSSVLRWTAQAAEALMVLHQHGVVHGDVKPSNLVLDRAGRIVVVDLGSSSVPAGPAPRGGTPGFRAPEVASGAVPTRRSDVYSLAATAFSLLTGSAPSAGLPAWDGIPPAVAARLEAGLRAGLAIDPERRPETPGQLVELLRAGWDDTTPSGVATVLTTEVAGGSELWEQSPQHVPAVLAGLQLVIDRAVEEHGGRRQGGTVEGTATISVFDGAADAVRAAAAIGRAMAAPGTFGSGPAGSVVVRAGLATGELVTRDGEVAGPAVRRAARVRDVARPGEILMSSSTADVVRSAPPDGLAVLPIGPHALRDHHGTDELAALVVAGIDAPPDPSRSPYPGLAAFAADDADLFFGREEVVERCLELVAANGFVAVVGASGTGKTSVALAGIAPRLAEIVVLRPGQHPMRSLDASSADALPEAVLIVDQLEEMVTLCADGDERAAFVEALTSRPGGVVVTLRADLYGELAVHADLAERLAQSQVLLGPLGPADLARAVSEPARRCGLVVEPGLAELIWNELGDEPGSLPLLGHALREAWQRREGRTITVAGYQASGGVRSAIAATAERALAPLDDDDRDVARRVLLRMVEVRPDREDARRWVGRRELDELEPVRSTAVVSALADARLLVADRDDVTVAHEALLRAWPRLGQWIADARADLLAQQELRWATDRWVDGGRGEADLYRGIRLESALALADNARLPAVEAEFVSAGRAQRDREAGDERRRVRRLRLLAAATSVLAVMALVVGAVAVVQRNDAQRSREAATEAARAARIEALVGRAESLRDTQRDTAALLAVEAFRLADTARTRSALLATFTDSEGFLDAHRRPGDTGGSGIVLPDGDGAYVAGDDGRLRPYDLDTGALGTALPALGGEPDPFSIVAASPDGRWLAQAAWHAGDEDPTTVGVYDLTTGELNFPPIVVDRGVNGAAFSGDDSRLALALGVEGRLLLVDPVSGATAADVPGLPQPADLQSSSSVVADGDAFLAGTSDGTVRVLDARTGEVRRTIPATPHNLSAIQPVGDGTVVASGRFGVQRLDTTTGAQLWERPAESCLNLAVVAGRGTFYCADMFGRLEERALGAGELLRRLDVQNGNSGSLWPARDGTELVSIGNNEPVVSRIRLDGTGPITRTVAPGNDVGTFSPDSGRLLVERGTSLEGAVSSVVDVASATVDQELEGLAIPSWRDDGTLQGIAGTDEAFLPVRVDLADPRLVPEKPLADVPDELVFESGKSHLLLAFNENLVTTVVSLDPTSRELGPPIAVEGQVSEAMAISTTGHRVAVGTRHGVDVFDNTTGALVGNIPGGALRSVSITLADQLYVGSLGGELTLYDLETLQAVRTFGGTRGYAFRVYGPADGSLIAVHGGDRTVTLYDVATGIRLGTPIGIGDDEVNEMALSPDGRWLAVGGDLEGVPLHGVELWDLDPSTWVAAACRLAGRNLSEEEWATNLGDLAPYRSTCPELPPGN